MKMGIETFGASDITFIARLYPHMSLFVTFVTNPLPSFLSDELFEWP